MKLQVGSYTVIVGFCAVIIWNEGE